MIYETHFTTTLIWKVVNVVTTPEGYRQITGDYVKITYLIMFKWVYERDDFMLVLKDICFQYKK